MKSYWDLDYRGKFIRTLWMLPVTILAIIVLLSFSAPLTIAVAVFLFLLLIGQLGYNYTKWKVKLKPYWQGKVDLVASKINIMPKKKAFVLAVTLIVITHILFYLLPISNWVMKLLEGIVYFFAFLYIFGVFDKKDKRTTRS